MGQGHARVMIYINFVACDPDATCQVQDPKHFYSGEDYFKGFCYL